MSNIKDDTKTVIIIKRFDKHMERWYIENIFRYSKNLYDFVGSFESSGCFESSGSFESRFIYEIENVRGEFTLEVFIISCRNSYIYWIYGNENDANTKLNELDNNEFYLRKIAL